MRNRKEGFTLLEVLVSLIVGILIIGSVMGVISESLRYRAELKEKAAIQPVLESAARIILADPTRALEGVLRLTELEGAPQVGVSVLPVPLEEPPAGEGAGAGRLCRVYLNYRSSFLEFSVIIPPQRR